MRAGEAGALARTQCTLGGAGAAVTHRPLGRLLPPVAAAPDRGASLEPPVAPGSDALREIRPRKPNVPPPLAAGVHWAAPALP